MNHKRWWMRLALVFLLHVAWSSNTLAQLPDTIERIKPAVVLVGTYRATDTPRFRYVGTGFVVGDGLRVVTNAHVTAAVGTVGPDGPALVVQLRAGAGAWTMRQARLLETVPEHDLALLQIDGPAAAALNVVASEPVREGEELAFMGFPIGGVLGFSSVTHRATVSSITTMALPSPTGQQLSERAIRSLRAGPLQVFQLDATAYPGNSGGPLFDPRSGAVLGVINMVLIKSTRESAMSQPSGISYAIPSRYVLELMARHR
ncbi:S1C family serine protease [Acidovorax carolinensis]|uniref:S1C family serine protease n=1 Tax=Acidovorax carolinensis TaxID=553814 RepID=UPI000B5E7F23|nr:trypsin-like peptidase domain-containing protein [Acidovorax carolinensis]ART49618.1 serine protease [Acidovorax carolinensis]